MLTGVKRVQQLNLTRITQGEDKEKVAEPQQKSKQESIGFSNSISHELRQRWARKRLQNPSKSLNRSQPGSATQFDHIYGRGEREKGCRTRWKKVEEKSAASHRRQVDKSAAIVTSRPRGQGSFGPSFTFRNLCKLGMQMTLWVLAVLQIPLSLSNKIHVNWIKLIESS